MEPAVVYYVLPEAARAEAWHAATNFADWLGGIDVPVILGADKASAFSYNRCGPAFLPFEELSQGRPAAIVVAREQDLARVAEWSGVRLLHRTTDDAGPGAALTRRPDGVWDLQAAAPVAAACYFAGGQKFSNRILFAGARAGTWCEVIQREAPWLDCRWLDGVEDGRTRMCQEASIVVAFDAVTALEALEWLAAGCLLVLCGVTQAPAFLVPGENCMVIADERDLPATMAALQEDRQAVACQQLRMRGLALARQHHMQRVGRCVLAELARVQFPGVA